MPIIEQSLVDAPMPNPLLDISETQSESAWSTDVLASDTERLTEVDNDDIASVARSDDASSVARSDDVTRSEGDDALQPDQSLPNRRLSNPSYQYVNNLGNLDVHFVEYRRENSSDSSTQVGCGKPEEGRQTADGGASGVGQRALVFSEYGQASSSGVERAAAGSERVVRGGRPAERRCSDGAQGVSADGGAAGKRIIFL